MIADMSPAAQGRAARRHPAARVVADWRDLVADPAVDAVMVATPVHTHFEIARAALRAGKHVLVEKPMTELAGDLCAAHRGGGPSEPRPDGRSHICLHRRDPGDRRPHHLRRGRRHLLLRLPPG